VILFDNMVTWGLRRFWN